MPVLTIIAYAVALAMDAFTVSVSNGVCIKKLKPIHPIKFGIYFGFFQFTMTIIGYYFGTLFTNEIKAIDHWISLVLLVILGIKMIYDSFNEDENLSCKDNGDTISSFKNLTLLAIATSIDALVIGVTFAFLEINIWLISFVIGITAFIFSFAGVIIGNYIGSFFKKGAEIAGGLILITLGLKTFIEHVFLNKG